MVNPQIDDQLRPVIDPLLPAPKPHLFRYPEIDEELTSLLHNILNTALQMLAANDAHIFLHAGERLGFGASLWSNNPKSNPTYTEPKSNGLTYL